MDCFTKCPRGTVIHFSEDRTGYAKIETKDHPIVYVPIDDLMHFAVTLMETPLAPDDDGYGVFRCPECGHVEGLQGWDCLGADDEKLFCNQCGGHVVPEAVEVASK